MRINGVAEGGGWGRREEAVLRNALGRELGLVSPRAAGKFPPIKDSLVAEKTEQDPCKRGSLISKGQ